MNNFQFNTPGKIILRPNCSSDSETYKGLNLTGRTLIVTDATLVKLGIADKVSAAMTKAGADVITFDQVEPEPKTTAVRKLIADIQKENIQLVVGLGGGSPMDVAKIASLLIPCPQPIESMYGVGNATGQRLPLILIPTTAGTGSEGTPVAVVTGDDGEKSPIVGPQFICDTVVLDPTLTLGLPSHITAATGVDAMVHAIEAYTSGVRKNPVSDQLALKALKLLYNNIKLVFEQGDKLEARSNMLVGSMMAGLAFANASVGAVHALAYPLGAHFHLSHGESNAAVLTPVMRFNLENAAPMYAELYRYITPKFSELHDKEAAEALIKSLEILIPELGLKNQLSQYNILAKDLDVLTDSAMKQARLLSYNIRTMNQNDIYQVFKSIL